MARNATLPFIKMSCLIYLKRMTMTETASYLPRNITSTNTMNYNRSLLKSLCGRNGESAGLPMLLDLCSHQPKSAWPMIRDERGCSPKASRRPQVQSLMLSEIGIYLCCFPQNPSYNLISDLVSSLPLHTESICRTPGFNIQPVLGWVFLPILL